MTKTEPSRSAAQAAVAAQAAAAAQAAPAAETAGAAAWPENRAAVQTALLAWYASHKRELPWRQDSDPYAVWVSEMMLQQTQVATVIPYFERWLKLFPDVNSLASAEEAEVLHAWQGLGYYSRARNLLRGARAVVERHGGQVPRGIEELRALPGVGPYTAGAIASIAHAAPEPIVDGNVIRVLSRLYALEGDPNKAAPKRRLWQLAEALVSRHSPGDFNQSLMELGATVCTPKRPRCSSCPVNAECLAVQQGRVNELPQTPPRAKPSGVLMVAAVVSREGHVLIGRLANAAPRWSGMWQFPTGERWAEGTAPSDFFPTDSSGKPPAPETSAECLARVVQSQTGLKISAAGLLTRVRHSVTRYKITLDAYACEATGGALQPGPEYAELRWVAQTDLTSLALPKAQRAVAESLKPGVGLELPF